MGIHAKATQAGWIGHAKPNSKLYILYIACVCLGVLLAIVPPYIVMARLAAVACVFATLIQPFFGLLLYLIVEYIRPGETTSLVGSRPALIIAAVTILGWVIARSSGRIKSTMWASQSWMVAGLIIAMLISIPTAFWKTQALQVTITAIKVGIIFFLMTNLISTHRRLKQQIWVMLLLGLFLACRSMLIYHRTGDFATGPGTGFLGDRNDLAMGMVVLIPLAGAIFQSSNWSAGRVLAGIIFVALIGGVVCTFSRGGFVGLIVVLVAIGFLAKRRVLALAGLFMLSAIAWRVAPPSYQYRILSISHYSEDESAQARLYAWRAARAMFHDRPFFGVGPGNFQTAYGMKYRPSEAPTIWRAPHSIYFESISELGITGSTFFGLLILLTYRDLIRLYRRRLFGGVSEWDRTMAAGIMAGMTGYLASATFLSAMHYSHPYYLAAFTMSLMSLARKKALEQGGDRR